MPSEYLDECERAFWRSQDGISALTFPEDESYEPQPIPETDYEKTADDHLSMRSL